MSKFIFDLIISATKATWLTQTRATLKKHVKVHTQLKYDSTEQQPMERIFEMKTGHCSILLYLSDFNLNKLMFSLI